MCSAGYAQQPVQQLRNHVHREISTGQAALVNPMSLEQQMNVSIVLPLRNQKELTSLLGRLYDPSSPDYRHFLTVAEFADRFGPTPEDYQAVVSFAQANGFTVTGTHANRLVVPISGSVAQINQAFNVRMNVYQHPTENRTFISPDREPSLNLSVPVAHISGLNNFSLPHPMLVRPEDGFQAASVTGSGPGGSYLGSDMRAAYYGGTTLTGNGQAVGILEFDGYNLSNVDLTFSNAGQSYNVPINNVLLDGATGLPVYAGNEAEVVLDIVQAIGMAPGLSQVRVYIGNGAAGLDDASILSSMASENIAKQLSCSWSWRPDDPAVADVFFQEFATQGQSFFVASGDLGAFDSTISPFFYPQEDDYVTAVGGTHLTTNGAGGAWVSESAWNSVEPGTTMTFGSGGGISPDAIPIPSWQTGLANSSNGGSTTLRNVPDVAMEGDFDNYLCFTGSCYGNGAGTSFAAPRWAGFMALINQQALEAGTAPNGGLGFLNPVLYAIGGSSRYDNELHDITVGNNQTGGQSVWFNAVPGYDLVTGWGSANGQSLIDDLAGPQVPGFWIAPSSSTVSINQGASNTTTITVTDAGGFSGNVTLAVTSALPSGVIASWGTNPTSGTSVLTLTASGTAPTGSTPIAITGTSGTLTATTNITVAVHSPTFTLSASPANVAVAPGNSTTTTITVTPQYGFTGNVNLSVSGLPSGVTASWGTNPTSGTSVLTLTASNAALGGMSTLTITGTSGSLSVSTTLALTVQAPSFTLSTTSHVDMGLSGSGNVYVYVYPQYGFTGSVNFAVSGLPSGVTASFLPNPATGYSVLALTTSSSATVGTATVTITGTSGSLTATTTFTLEIHAPTFTLSSSGSVSVGQGTSSTAYVSVNAQYGFTGSVTFSISGLPSGVTALWNPNPTSSSSVLTLSASSSVPVGQYTLTITGTSGTQTATTTLTLGVFVPTFTLSGPGSVSIGQGTSTTSYVWVSPQYGFTGSVNLSVSGLPSGITASFSPNPTTGNSNLTLTASGSAPVGQYTLTITGTSGTHTATTTLSLGVFVPTFTLTAAGTVTIGQGTTTTSWVNVNPMYGFTGSVNLSVSGLPSGVTATFSPNPTTSNSTLTLTVSGSVAVGQYTLTITGTSGSQTATTTLTLGVYVPTFTLSTSGLVNIGQGTTTTSYVYVYPQYGFNGNVALSISGLPIGVTASFSPNPAPPPNPSLSYSILTLTASSSTSLGQYAVTITGTSGTQTATTTFTLGVYVPSFTLSSPGILNIGQGSSGAAYINISPQYGFNGSVNLAASGLPSGVTASFSPNPAASTSTLTLTAGSTAATGQYTVTITGTSGTQTASVTLTLGIYAQTFSLYAYPASLYMNEGASGTVNVSINSQYGFNSNVTFSASNVPSGVTATFSPNPATGSTTLTLAASSNAIPGAATITITGSSGSITASTTITLIVNTPGFALLDAPNEVTLLPGSSENSTIVLVPQNGFTGSVSLAASGLPSGVTASFSPNPATANSTLTLTASSSAAPGTAAVTITGTSGSLVSATPLALTIKNASPATSTTLTLTSSGSPITTVASGTAVTLAAAVSSGSAPVTVGQVNFCDATATYCDEAHRLGSAQLTSAGSAALKFFPRMGSHSYKAVFAGTNTEAASTSDTSSLTVTASQASATTIAQSGSPGNYTLTATVTGQGLLSPTGTVSFLDTTNANSALGSANLQHTGAASSWMSSQTSSTDLYLNSIVAGDFNGDGKVDLAVANDQSHTLTILLGNGDGTFTAVASKPQISGQPLGMVVGDFNGDGKADLAVVNHTGNSVTILLGNGDGTFVAGSTQTGYYPTGIAVGDFNGDGVQDLAVTSSGNNTVTVLLGNGDGTFSSSTLSPQTGNYPELIVAGDFNGDDKEDLAVANNDGTLTILIGNGDGTFTPAPGPPMGSTFFYSVAAGDFNGDGKLDLAVPNPYSNTVTILLGNGDGTFTAAVSTPKTGNYPFSISVADFNADGNLDLAITALSGTSTILLGNGDGTFTAAESPSGGTSQRGVTAGDFNGDGIPDLAITNYSANAVTILTSQLTQTATATATGISPIGTGSHNVEASYAGDSDYKASVSTTTGLTAVTIVPTMTVTPSSLSITVGQDLTVNVTVSGTGGNPTPTGTVVLTSGNYTAQQTLSNGTVSFALASGTLGVGPNMLTASYSGDGTYTVASATANVTISKVAISLPSLSPVSPGASTTGTVTVSAGSAYAGTINLTCALTASPAGAQYLPTCSLSPASLALSAGGTGTSVFTAKTTAPSTASHAAPDRLKLWGIGSGGSVLALVLLFRVPRRRRRWASMLVLIGVMLAVGQIGCGGGGSSQPTPPPTQTTPGTTAGVYTFALTGTDMANAKITASTTVTVTVQ